MSRGLQKISQSLSHVNSFSGALSSFSQVDKIGMIIWGSLQIVIQCVCQFSDDINSTFELMAEVNSRLPKIYSIYIDSCLVIMREFAPSQSPIRSLFRKVYSSRLKRSLEKAVTHIEKHERRFFQAIEQADREARTARDIVVTTRLGTMSAAMGLQPSDNPLGALKSSSSVDIVPRVSTVPGLPNPSFVGRDKELTDIHDYFVSQRTPPPSGGPACVVIRGLGGQGKTQTALAYYWKHREQYDATFWIKSETPEQIETSFLAIAKKLRSANLLGSSLPPSPEVDVSWEIERAREWLEGTNKKWLLIFDNVEVASLLETFVPENISGGSVIITTQHAHISPVTQHFRKLELQPLLEEPGSTLFFRILERSPTDEEEESTAHEICRWVGGLPLAIVTVAGYLKCSASSPAEIISSLQRSATIWASSGIDTVRNYDKTLATVFDLALRQISEDSRNFLQILAFLSPAGIPEELLRRSHSLTSLQFLNDDERYLAVRQDLGLRQLIKRQRGEEGFQLEIHRSLQMILLLGLATNEDILLRSKVFQEVVVMLDAVLPQASRLAQNEPKIWPIFFRYVPQVLALRQNSLWPNPPIELDIGFAKMLSNIGTFLWKTGQFRECDLAMATAEAVLKQQPPETLESVECETILSDIYLVTGILSDCIGVSRRRQSLEHRQILLKLREKELKAISPESVTTEDEIRWGNAKGDLSCAYFVRGEFQKTRELMEELLVYYKKWGSEDEYPFGYSKYYHHLGHVLMAEGNPDQAIEYCRKGMQLDEAHAGSADSVVLIDHYDLACLLFYAGRLDESLAEHKKVLEKRIVLCGKNSQFTSESHEAVGILLHLAGRNPEAEQEFTSCLNSHNRATWTVEGVARAQYWSSRVLTALGKYSEAAKQMQSATAVKVRYLQEYPEFLTEDPQNEAAVYDQMVPMWIMQTSGPLQDGGKARLHS